jgi:23S rRNA (cytosine1962-C5)-methyltransferase
VDISHRPPVKLRKGEERRLLKGHPWVFSNEVESDLRVHAPGDVVDVVDARGHWMGRGTVNPHALIAVRLYSVRPAEAAGPDPETLATRLEAADSYRRALLRPLPEAYRVVHGEADFLPGLVVDRYNDVLVVQALTAGIDRRLENVCDILEERFSPRAIIGRNDSPVRALESLDLHAEVLRGSCDGAVWLEETPAPGLKALMVEIDPLHGQKTGAFLDQRANLSAAVSLMRSASVLDLFCHDGFWSLGAGRAGARSVLGIDSSAAAVERATALAARNELGAVCSFRREDVFQSLRDGKAGATLFDVVLLDPPAFIKKRARFAEGLKGYVTVNQRAMRLVRPGGWLVSSSCSHHLDRQAFRQMLVTAAGVARRCLRLVEMRGARADHPVLPAVPETDYLKCAICQVL